MASTNESWIISGVDFPIPGRKASVYSSPGIFTAACHTRSTRRLTNKMRDERLSGWTVTSTAPELDPSI